MAPQVDARERIPLQHDRRTEIVDRLQREGSARIDELAAALGVSEMTVRRDLEELAARGVARRVRGGAVPVGPGTFAERHPKNVRAKSQIAEKLGGVLPTSGTVALDASSTVHLLAERIEGARDLVVVTNGIDTFRALQDRPGVTASLTGGSAEPRTGSLVGPLATRVAADCLFDLFICSAAAVDAQVGSSEASWEEAAIKRAFARSSTRTILAVDTTKLGTRAPARAFRLDDLHLVVTEADPSDDRLVDYHDGVDII